MDKDASKTIDRDVLAGYDSGIEKNRLRSDLGRIEFDRTLELLREFLPPARPWSTTSAAGMESIRG